jgi:hypothetical protein
MYGCFDAFTNPRIHRGFEVNLYLNSNLIGQVENSFRGIVDEE